MTYIYEFIDIEIIEEKGNCREHYCGIYIKLSFKSRN
jgi:hypothetical protein